MPVKPAVIWPELVMPPENVETFVTEMPMAGSIVPLLVMPPLKVETPLMRMPVPAAEMVPALLTPPPNCRPDRRRCASRRRQCPRRLSR